MRCGKLLQNVDTMKHQINVHFIHIYNFKITHNHFIKDVSKSLLFETSFFDDELIPNINDAFLYDKRVKLR